MNIFSLVEGVERLGNNPKIVVKNCKNVKFILFCEM